MTDANEMTVKHNAGTNSVISSSGVYGLKLKTINKLTDVSKATNERNE